MSAQVRFVHAADLHLGAPFKGVAAVNERVRSALVDAQYRALDSIVDLCLEQEADFLVLAGDVYDSQERGVRPQLVVAEAARRLGEAGIGVFIVHGNHDPAHAKRAAVQMPESVHVFAHDRVERVPVERDGAVLCAVYGRSFGSRGETANLAAGFRRDPADRIAIGVLHTNVGGRPGYDNYAPCSPDDLRDPRMDYWALGHIHEPGVVLEDPLAVYAGAPQGMDPTQRGDRGCYLVSVKPGAASAEFVPVASVLWESRRLDLTGAVSLDEVEERIAALCAEVATEATRPVILRIALEGRCDAHAALAVPTSIEELVTSAREQAMRLQPWVWIDKVSDRTGSTIDLDAIRSGTDLAADIVLIADELLGDAERGEAVVRDALAGIRKRLPTDVAIDEREIASAVIERARDRVLDELLSEVER